MQPGFRLVIRADINTGVAVRSVFLPVLITFKGVDGPLINSGIVRKNSAFVCARAFHDRTAGAVFCAFSTYFTEFSDPETDWTIGDEGHIRKYFANADSGAEFGCY